MKRLRRPMNSLDVIRKLCDAIAQHQRQLHEDGIGPDLLLAVVARDADEYLKTGGWHKWPEEKPEEGKYYLLLVGDLLFRTAAVYLDGWIYKTAEHIRYWHEWPEFPLPSDKPEELHGKDGG
jgi:hypothetical protein